MPTAVIHEAPTPPPPPATGCDHPGNGPVAVRELESDDQLLVDRWTLTPPVVGAAPDALTVRFHVMACQRRPVQGALVYVTAVPYKQFTVPSEVATGADGWAELRIGRLRGYPANPGRQHRWSTVLAARRRWSGATAVSNARAAAF